jgi:hypothetical protein
MACLPEGDPKFRPRQWHLRLICMRKSRSLLLLDLYDRRIDGYFHEFDSVLAILLAAISLATDRNRFLIICSEAPAPFAGRIVVNVEDHDGKVVRFLPMGPRRLINNSARGGT